MYCYGLIDGTYYNLGDISNILEYIGKVLISVKRER